MNLTGAVTLSGNVMFANFQAARTFAQKINGKRDLVNYPERAVQAGEINAMGLIDEILHHVIALYRARINPAGDGPCAGLAEGTGGCREVDECVVQVSTEFPPLAVYRGEITLAEYLRAGQPMAFPIEQILLEEMLMLWLGNKNPAFTIRTKSCLTMQLTFRERLSAHDRRAVPLF